MNEARPHKSASKGTLSIWFALLFALFLTITPVSRAQSNVTPGRKSPRTRSLEISRPRTSRY